MWFISDQEELFPYVFIVQGPLWSCNYSAGGLSGRYSFLRIGGHGCTNMYWPTSLMFCCIVGVKLSEGCLIVSLYMLVWLVWSMSSGVGGTESSSGICNK